MNTPITSTNLRPVTEPAAWLRHERAVRGAQLMAVLLLEAGDHATAGEWLKWLVALHAEKPLDCC